MTRKKTDEGGLGYQGLKKFKELEEANKRRIAQVQKLGEGLASQGFHLLEEPELSILKNRAMRGIGYDKKGLRQSLVQYLKDVGNGILNILSEFWLALGLAIIGWVLVSILVFILGKISLTLEWGDETIPLATAVLGLGLILIPTWKFIGFVISIPTRIFALTKPEDFQWHRVPIQKYLPPINPFTVERIEKLDTFYKEAGLSVQFFILHGTVHREDTLTDEQKTITGKSERLAQWCQEPAFLELSITFEDKEIQRLAISELSLG